MSPLNDFLGPEVIAFVSDRSLDFSLNDQNVSFSPRQKKYLFSRLGYAYPNIFNIRQMHGEKVVVASAARFPYKKIIKADGAVTNFYELPLAVRTADCVPIFLFDPVQRAIGAVHAGWRGTRKKVLVNALKLMRRRYKTAMKDLKVAFGPAIGACCYEVEKGFKRYFPKAIVQRKDKYFLDLTKANKQQLVRMGVLPSRIYDPKICTMCHPRYFSYRKEGQGAGRMISVIQLKSKK